jgi:hypothetical protein
MNACPPVSENRAMTFATESVAFIEVDEFSVVEPEFVSVSCVMAIVTPPHCLGMVELDLGMFFF